jgi:hypothetical protein
MGKYRKTKTTPGEDRVVPFLLEFSQVLYIVGNVLTTRTKYRLNDIADISACLPAMEKAFPYTEKLLQVTSRGVSARIFRSVIQRWKGCNKQQEPNAV